jgi:hypothetical protein
LRVWIGFVWLRIETVVRYCEHGNDPYCSIEVWKFLEMLNVLSAVEEGLCSLELLR